ncbi:MAG: cyclic nucleotide-binding domain-containing protein [Bdellovibrionales bacterium]|nr:cyclic nucleotide-binding domain-containing protein [Bdellovibrionales bacterium]
MERTPGLKLVNSVNSSEPDVRPEIYQSGDFVGEIAMLSGKKRTATVKALTDVEVFCLKRIDAAKVLRGNRDILVLLQSKMKERKKETNETLDAYREAQNTLSLV